jgi:hypothetical protein
VKITKRVLDNEWRVWVKSLPLSVVRKLGFRPGRRREPCVSRAVCVFSESFTYLVEQHLHTELARVRRHPQCAVHRKRPARRRQESQRDSASQRDTQLYMRCQLHQTDTRVWVWSWLR